MLDPLQELGDATNVPTTVVHLPPVHHGERSTSPSRAGTTRPTDMFEVRTLRDPVRLVVPADAEGLAR